MNEHEDIDRRLTALLSEGAAPPDPAFAKRVLGLAAHDLAVRRFRRRAVFQTGREALALVAVLICFVGLALKAPGPTAGLGDVLPLASPATLGLTLLALWALVAFRGRAAA